MGNQGQITLIPIGSRGDVQPFVALGCQLKHAGHRVRVATHASFAEFVRGFGLDFFPIGGDPERTLKELSPRLTSRNPLVAMPALLEVLSQLIIKALRGVAEVITDRVQRSDVIIASYPALFSAIEAAEEQRVSLLVASLQPVTPTAAREHVLMPSPVFVPPAWRWAYNRLSHWVGDDVLFRTVRRQVDAARARELGLGPCTEAPIRTVHTKRLPILYPFSPTLYEAPTDWPAHTHITGSWFLDPVADFQPPAELRDFLEAGPPPIYVGFGSTQYGALPVLRLFRDALAKRRQRALFLMPELDATRIDLPDHILPIGNIPHGWLFPRTSAVIHHGGIGTISEALRAGAPQGIIHSSVEQAFWGRAASRIGVAPPARAARALGPAAAVALLNELLSDSSLRSRANLAAAAVRRERGTAHAATIIERVLSRL